MKKLLLLFILLVNIFACKKRYEEGPLISFRSVNDRITGTWKLEYLEMNGNDVSFFIDSLEIDSFRFTNEKESFCGSDRCPVLETFLNSEKYCRGTFYWTLDSAKQRIALRHRLDYCPHSNLTDSISMPIPALVYADQPINNNLSERWQILKLSMKQMWLEMEYNGNTYKAHFGKIREINNGI